MTPHRCEWAWRGLEFFAGSHFERQRCHACERERWVPLGNAVAEPSAAAIAACCGGSCEFCRRMREESGS